MNFLKCFSFLCVILMSTNVFAQGVSNDVIVRMGEMDETFRQTQGKVEELEHKVKQLEKKMELMKKDNELRFAELEKKISQAQTAKTIAKPAVKPAAPVKVDLSGSVEDLYKKGLAEINAGKNQEAIAIFSKILKDNPTHKLAGNAQYWMGEAYYAEKDFPRAAVTFAKGYENYKTGQKGADSLLKLGMSMVELKKIPEACAAFKSLPTEFPKTSDVLKKKAAELSKKYDCK